MNKKHRHLLALLLCFVMTVSLFAGYSETKAASEETTQSEEQTETQETGETREITDMAGRKVTVRLLQFLCIWLHLINFWDGIMN